MKHATVSCRYLYKSTSDGVQDYLCNRLYTLPEKGLERYLSQLCQLIINQPRSSLERVMVDLCARSLRIAVKVDSARRAGAGLWMGNGSLQIALYCFAARRQAPA